MITHYGQHMIRLLKKTTKQHKSNNDLEKEISILKHQNDSLFDHNIIDQRYHIL
jgi:cell division protein FtsB